jgi:hypothetical protein
MLYYAQGSAILTPEEILEPTIYDALVSFHKGLSAGENPSSVTLPTGELSADTVVTGVTPLPDLEPIKFQEIGLGKPLTIMIREVYTGKYPKGGLFDSGKDMLITSAIKSAAVSNAKPLALNFLKKKVASGSRLERPAASEQGTPFVFYSPALLEKSLTMDLKMVFDTFDQEIFNQVGDAFSAAAGIPVFMAQSFYLIAAGMITKLIGKAGEAIFDGKPVFDSSDPVDIYLPGKPPLPAGFLLVTGDNIDTLDKDFRKKYRVNALGKVVDSAGAEYKGEIPYIVASADGTVQEELKEFAPTAVSAATLNRFFGVKDGQSVAIDIVISALKLYNDVSFRKQLEEVDKQLASMPEGEAKEELKKKRAALLANITEDLLKPKQS